MNSMHELFQAAQAGQKADFLELSEALRPRLEKFVSRRMGSHLRKHVDVEDVVQESIMRSMHAIERAQWRGDGALFSWFCGIASNVILELERRFLRVQNLPDRELKADITSPSRHLRRKERFSRLQKSLERLTEEQREVIQLFRIEGLPLAEVAQRMGRKEKATYQLLWRAMEKLKEDFEETGSLHLPDERLNGAHGHEESS